MLDRTGVQTVTLCVALVGIVLMLIALRRNPGRWLVAIAPLTWLGHIIVFYVVVLWFPLESGTSNWSAIVRLHGVLCVIPMGLAMLSKRR